MALPTSRNTTYAAGSQVKSFDLNDIQDNIIGEKYPSRTDLIHPSAALPRTDAQIWTLVTNTSGGGGLSYIADGSGSSGLYTVPLRLAAGDRVTAVSARIKSTGSAASIRMFKSAFTTGSQTQVGTTGTSGTGGTDETISVGGLGSPVAVAADELWFVEMDIPNGGRFYGLKVTRDRL